MRNGSMYFQQLTHTQSRHRSRVTVCKYVYIIILAHRIRLDLTLNPMMASPYGGCLRLPHLDMCFGFVEQSQRGVPTAVWSQRDEGLQPFQTQAEMCSSVGGDESFLFTESRHAVMYYATIIQDRKLRVNISL